MSLNRVIIMGRLTRDVELRHTQSGTPVANFTLAVDRDFRDKATGDLGVDFIDVIAWRSTGEFAAKYMSKGRMAVVDGRLQIREWTDKDGNKRRNAEVVADSIYFGDSKRDGDGGNQQGGSYGRSEALSAGYGYDTPIGEEQFSEMEEDEGDLPF